MHRLVLLLGLLTFLLPAQNVPFHQLQPIPSRRDSARALLSPGALSAPAAERFAAARRLGQEFRFRLPLPSGRFVDATVQSADVWNSGETVTWNGTIDSALPGHFSLAITGSLLDGYLVTGDGSAFEFHGDAGNVEIRPVAENVRCDGPLVPEFPSPPKLQDALPVRQTIGPDAVIDVLVVYTPALRTKLGGEPAVLNAVRSAISYTNQSLANSNLALRISLAGTKEVAYTESTSLNTNISRVQTPGDGFLDDVPVLRDQLAADVVSLWTDDTPATFAAAGLGYQMTSNSASLAPFGYNTVVGNLGSISLNPTFAHELGHNLGANHDRLNLFPTAIPYPFAVGYQAKDSAPYFRDIMAYQCASVYCPTVPYYSSPDVLVYGKPIGIPRDRLDSADVAGAFSLTGTTVASYRSPRTTGSGLSVSPAEPASVSAAGAAVSLSVSSDSSWTAVSNSPWVSVPASGSGSASLTAQVAANSGSTARSALLRFSSNRGAESTVLIHQRGVLFSFDTQRIRVPAAAGSASLGVLPDSPAATWTAAAFGIDPFVTLANPSGIGPQSLTLQFAANPLTIFRTSTLEVGGATLEIEQQGAKCATVVPYTLGSTLSGSGSRGTCRSSYIGGLTSQSIAIAARHSFSGTAGQLVRFSVNVSAVLTLENPAGDRLVQVSGASPSLPGVSTFLVLPATGLYYLEIASDELFGFSYTLQSTVGTTATVNLSSSSVSVPATAGAGSVTVTSSSPSAVWSTLSSAGWLYANPVSGSGNQTLTYVYSTNAGPARSATITVGTSTLTVNQAAATVPGPSVRETGPLFLSGQTQSFTLKFSHPQGFAQLGVVNALINQYLNGDSACYIAYSQPLGVLYLVNDLGPGNGISSGLTLGAAGSVSNSQCTINGAASSATTAGTTLTLVLNITFKPAFTGSKVLYLAAQTTGGVSTGWETMGVAAIPETSVSAPRAIALSPATGTALSQVLSFTYADASNLQTVWALMNTAIDGRQACYAAYYIPGNTLYLYPDNGDGTQAASIAMTGTNTIENSQCRISAQGSSYVAAGAVGTLNLNVQFKPPFSGPRGIWAAAQTTGGLQTSPWKPVGAWLP